MGPGPSNQPFSMTEVAVVTMAPNSFISVGAVNTTATPPPPLTLGCSAATGMVGVPYSSSLNPMGGFPPYTFSITMGSLPPVLNLNPARPEPSPGLPPLLGTFNFTAQVVDSSGNIAINTKTVGCKYRHCPIHPAAQADLPSEHRTGGRGLQLRVGGYRGREAVHLLHQCRRSAADPESGFNHRSNHRHTHIARNI